MCIIEPVLVHALVFPVVTRFASVIICASVIIFLVPVLRMSGSLIVVGMVLVPISFCLSVAIIVLSTVVLQLNLTYRGHMSIKKVVLALL